MGNFRDDRLAWCRRTLPALILLLPACASTPDAAERVADAPRPEAVAPEVVAPEVVAPEVNVRKEPGPFAACRQRVKSEEVLLDETRRRLEETVCGAALWFDGLFGTKGDLAAARSSYGRVELATDYSKFYGSSTALRFNARVQLPTLQNRLSAFVGLDNEDDFVRDRSEGQALRSRTRNLSDRDQFLLGVGFTSVTTEEFQSEFKVGVRNVRLPKIFVQNRFTYIPYSDRQYRVLSRTTPFWNNRDGAGLTQSTDLDWVLTEDFLLRWGTVGTVTEETEGVDWRSALILYQNLRGESALAYEMFIRGASRADETVAEYGVRAIYRRPLFQRRLFAGLILGYSWPRDDPALPREGSTNVGFGLEMPFGKAPG